MQATLSGLQTLRQWLKEIWSEKHPQRRILHDFGRQLHRPIVLFSLIAVLLPCFFLAGYLRNIKPEEKQESNQSAPSATAVEPDASSLPEETGDESESARPSNIETETKFKPEE